MDKDITGIITESVSMLYCFVVSWVGVFTIGCTSSGNELHLSIIDSVVVPTGLLVLKNSVSVRFTIKLMIS